MGSTPARPPTLADVAARAGVSRALVSIVMREAPGASDATRARVLEVARSIGYRPDSRARLLAGRHSRLLGVTLALESPFHTDVAAALYAAAEPLGYEVILSAMTGARSAERAVDTLLTYRCEAAVLIGGLPSPQALREIDERMPLVVLGQAERQAGVDVVRTSDSRGMRLAVDHLVDAGHRRIAHVDGGTARGATARRQGYRDAMRARGLAGNVEIVTGGESEDDGAGAALRMISTGLPDAVIAYNDRSSVGLLDMLARRRVEVPDEVSVVGYDDSRVARLSYLQLTTISQDIDGLALTAVRRAVERIEGAEPARRDLVLTPRLVVRGTTAPARVHSG